jgi:flagellar hook-associated protein 3 FlgL
MRITANTLVDRLVLDLNRLSGDQARYSQILSSGRKLIDPSDNPSATGRVMGYESEKRMLQQFDRNAARAVQNIAVSSTHLEGLRKIAGEAFNLAPAASLTGDPQLRATYRDQLNGYLEQALQIANGQLNGSYLFGAAATDAAPFTATRDAQGRITSVAYVGAAGDPAAINVAEGARVLAATTGTENAQLAAFLNSLVQLRDAVGAADPAGMTTHQNAVGDAQDNILGMLGNLTVAQFRTEVTREQNTVRFNQLANLSARETEADMADTIMRLKQSETSYQAAIQAGARLMSQSLLDYIR